MPPSDHWPYGTIVEDKASAGEVLRAMVIHDSRNAIQMISISGDLVYKGSFYAFGEVWEWMMDRDWWAVVK